MAVSPRRRRRPATWDDAEAYDRFMGRFSAGLAPQMADLAVVSQGGRVLDVGCGPGALTGELARRLGPEAVTALDPSEPFIAAVSDRYPGVSVHRGVAESLPFPDRAFDAVVAQLAIQFFTDREQGLAEMVRVTRSDGVVASCDWHHWHGSPHGPFFQVTRELRTRGPWKRDFRPAAVLLRNLGVLDVQETVLPARVRYEDFDQWWAVATGGVGTSAMTLKKLDPEKREILRNRCRDELPDGAFTIDAFARAAWGRVP
jgi:SAM-dependent methyltransferase